MPDLAAVKYFLRFRASVMRGKIEERPTDESLNSFAEWFFAGFIRVTDRDWQDREERSIQHALTTYRGTKSALLRLNNFIMAEYGDQGILAYGIHPGGVMAELGSNLPKEMHEAILIDKPELAGDTVVWLTKEKRG